MKISSRQLARTLVDHTEGLSENELQKVMKDFVSFLSLNNLLTQWRDVEKNIHLAWKDKYGVSVMNVLSAHDLEPEARKGLEDIASGAETNFRVDERLIGGAIVRIDDVRYDGSITGSLKRLKQTLSA